ncbi:MAG: hypothetical protein COU25_02855 [Candidatus Levybacteria bacterium CG10_big_fil_rev_8_21_14_0_10_35_13]|nr:MAG: hypothetical protein COU25_02855 [Candidatus Levybacteria bacterium CG10_big_fil_rev_8_21_14_0_10_35_13]
MKKKPDQIIISDSKYIKNIFVQVDLKKNRTIVHSGFSPWENLAFIIEGLSTTAEECIKQGMDRKDVYKFIYEYLVKTLPTYFKNNKTRN